MPTPVIARLRATFLPILRPCLLPGLLPGLVLGLTTTAATADTYTVAPSSPGTIQALIDLVLVDGDVIQLEAGTYLLSDTITIIDRSITIRGVSEPKTGEPLSILDGQDTHRVCLTNGGSNTFETLVFTRGFSDGSSGGGLLGDNNTFDHCTFESNQASSGGGVNGGYNTFDHCTFESNQANYGGGVQGYGNTFDDSTFTGNTAEFRGGGLDVFSDNTLTNCLITGNTAPLGAGMYFSGSPIYSTDLTTCTISGNTAQKEGGGLWIGQLTTVRITGSSICENAPEDIVGDWQDLGDNDGCGATPCPADIDGDGTVNATELGLLLALWGTSNPLADLDGDGIVRAGDLGIVLSAWGPCPE